MNELVSSLDHFLPASDGSKHVSRVNIIERILLVKPLALHVIDLKADIARDPRADQSALSSSLHKAMIVVLPRGLNRRKVSPNYCGIWKPVRHFDGP